MERAVVIYTTFPGLVEAERIGRTLVERRLAACANILPGMVSHYRWKGQVERAEEVVMLVKTRASLAEEVSTEIRKLHSYEVPAVVVISLESVERHYLGWLLGATGPEEA
jgi:periplasmic divalent cation tolerance protein